MSSALVSHANFAKFPKFLTGKLLFRRRFAPRRVPPAKLQREKSFYPLFFTVPKKAREKEAPLPRAPVSHLCHLTPPGTCLTYSHLDQTPCPLPRQQQLTARKKGGK